MCHKPIKFVQTEPLKMLYLFPWGAICSHNSLVLRLAEVTQ